MSLLKSKNSSFHLLTADDVKILTRKILVGLIIAFIPLFILGGGLYLIIRLLTL